MKRIIVYSLLLLIPAAGIPLKAQEINMLYTLANTPQANNLNPARITDNAKVTVHLPLLSGLHFKLQNSFSFNHFVSIENKKAVFDFGQLQKSMGPVSYLTETMNLPLFELQVRFGRNLISTAVSEQQLFRFQFDRNLIQLINEGNESFIDQPFSTHFDFNFLHYREYGLGYTRQIIPELSIGGRIKLLTGFAAADVQKMNIGLQTGRNLEYLTFSVDGAYNLSLPVDFQGESPELSFDPAGYLTNFANTGVAFDLGASYQPLPELELSASVIDLGFINWKTNATRISHGGTFTWKGFNLNSFIDQPEAAEGQEVPDLNPIEQLMDSAMQLVDFRIEALTFTTGIPTKVFISGEYHFHKVVSVALTDQILLYDRQISNALTLSGNLKLGDIWALSAGYSIIDQSYNNLSLGTSLNMGPVGFYIVTSNILALNIQQTSNFSLQFGLHFLFGKRISP
ncbi:MAG TPA: DUF5723 family protein [Prolixibacteraceae bacterium]|nr:DUF5723 family protein [Prolixibacteraceae bacterium]